MSDDGLPEAAWTYLRELDAELSDVPSGTAEEIVADVRAHIADALDSGRSIGEILAGLGGAPEVARAAREELGLPAQDRTDRAGRTLSLVAVAAGVLIAVCVSFLLPSTVPVEPIQADAGEQGVLRRLGPGIALLTLLPALVAAAPLVAPARVRAGVRFAGAAVLTMFACAAGETGLYYFPLALMAWAAAIVPWAVRRGAGGRWWRYLTGGVVAMPGVLVAVASAGESVSVGWMGAALWIAGPLAAGALCAYGIRAGYAVTALAGALVMVLAMTERGFLFAAFWLFGGLYLALGAGAYAASRATDGEPAATPGPPARPEPAPAPGG
ncbi:MULTISPECIES: HAAS signaling domain-containing protein [unclassified Micromonospora]|uniref:HAAS signaling domain-containing protein n=1 Tax=unclassified Micromonospora TaxID=2617518 RepID=UPI001B37DC3A|nr:MULTISPECIES: hypothetical protein [unclassified Micromonospora]MBQ1041677.1 hypothetical protein [Micromonospora sp. C72]MBQ1053278.1 hypothetical protein [Micromonospora sp. C32]